MASSENQGLQAGLIISVILTIGLGVTTYLFYSQWDGAEQEVTARTKERDDNQAALTKMQTEANEIKRIAGYADADSIEKIQVDFAALRDPLLNGRAPESFSLLTLFKESQTKIADEVQRYAALEAENNDLKKTNEQREAAKQAQITEAVTARDAAIKEARDATEKFNATQAEATKTATDLQAQLDAARKEMETVKADAAKKVSDIEEQMKRLGGIVDQRTTELENVKNESFDIPHGKITLVNQRNRTVWINLGEDDKLRRQVVFSVYPIDENAVGNDLKSKGTVEVTQILGPHLAEARIRDDDFADPFIPGDKVYTALWAPGEKIHVALAGLMDMNDDNSSDLELLRKVITAGGAVIDAEVDEKGNVTGALTPQTGFLILGKEPPQRDSNEAAMAPYTKMRRDAISYGLKTISLEQFLKRSGWKDIKQVMNYSRPGTATDFLPEAKDGSRPPSTGRTSELFRQRRPTNQAKPEAQPATP